MRLGSPLGEAQTETETAVGARLALTDSIEPVENMGLVFGRDARPGIADLQTDIARKSGPVGEREAHDSARRRAAHGVRDQL